MFQGSIPNSIQKMFVSIVKEWNVEDIYIGCSGNFTIERVLENSIKAQLHSNDVSLYSYVLGKYLSGQKIEIQLNEERDETFFFIEKYIKDDAAIVACVLLLTNIANYVGKTNNAYYAKMLNAYIAQWEHLFETTYNKISKIQPFIKSFDCCDVYEWINNIPDNAGFITYPPFFKGGYEKMFNFLNSIFLWKSPEYEIMTTERIDEMFKKITDRKHFIFATNHPIEEFDEYYMGLSQTTNKGVPIHVYSDCATSKIILPNQNVKSILCEHIGKEEDIGNEIKIIKLKSENFHALRSQYINVTIKPASETAAYGVLIDNKLIGVYALSAAPTLADWNKYIETPSIYLLSDFPISPSKYTRLSKLVLYAALSKESKLLAEGLTNKRVKSIVTTAFTNNPVSMKYRGLLKLLTKKEFDDGEHKYALNYGAEIGKWSLREGLEMWKKNHSQIEVNKN